MASGALPHFLKKTQTNVLLAVGTFRKVLLTKVCIFKKFREKESGFPEFTGKSRESRHLFPVNRESYVISRDQTYY